MQPIRSIFSKLARSATATTSQINNTQRPVRNIHLTAVKYEIHAGGLGSEEPEDLETKRKRLIWQSRKRGISENDLLLSTWFNANNKDMTFEQMDEYWSLEGFGVWFECFRKNNPNLGF